MILLKNKKYYKAEILRSFPNTSSIFNKKNTVLIYGAARLGRKINAALKKKGVNITAFIDKNTKLYGTLLDGIRVISLKEAKKNYQNNPIIIGSLLYQNQIYRLLNEAGFKKVFPIYFLNLLKPKAFPVPEIKDMFNAIFTAENRQKIKKVYDLLADKESKRIFENLLKYRITADPKFIDLAKSKNRLFNEKEIFQLSRKEIFVDCGAYDGDTCRLFLKATDGKFDMIYAFEPDRNNFKKLYDWIKNLDPKDMFAVQKGIYSETGSILFKNDGTLDSNIPNYGKVLKNQKKSQIKGKKSDYIEVISIDKFFINKKPPTLIKMDIEGSELKALEGAKKIIKNSKPKLAISIYHKPADLWKLILFIRNINKKYRFYIRHYTSEIADTICYAV